eukprot:Gb_40730 [translate_table: standard]
MGGVTISGAGTRAQFGVAAVNTGLLSDRLAVADRSFSQRRSLYKFISKQKPDLPVKVEHGKDKNRTPMLAASEPLPLLNSSVEKHQRFLSRIRKTQEISSRLQASALKKASTCTIPAGDLDYSEAAATLENIYNDSPASVSGSDLDLSDKPEKIQTKRKSNKSFSLHSINDEKTPKFSTSGEISASIKPKRLQKSTTEKKFKRTPKADVIQVGHSGKPANVVVNFGKCKKRLNLDTRIALRKRKLEKIQSKDRLRSPRKKKVKISDEDPDFWCEEVDELLKTCMVSMDLMSLDWNRLTIRRILSPAEQFWLSKLMQPMKSHIQTKKTLKNILGRDATEEEIATASKTDVTTVKRQMDVGRAARNKLIQHNLRLVLFEVYKYNIEGTGLGFHDACQEGANGLMIAVDKFEPKKGFRLSTYALYWIRHAIMRAITLSNFRRTPFIFSKIKLDIQRATLDLLLKVGRSPTHEEIRAQVGLEKQRYYDVIRTSKKILSLNKRHRVTEEEFIDSIPDQRKGENKALRPQTLLRLGLDDVLDSLKPKESLVIRQRFGLDGKGERSLGEIARNLNISREMVRKHEVKGLMKLKHPSRVEYLRSYLV